MTTIAWDGRTLAGDRRGNAGGMAYELSKIRRTADGRLPDGRLVQTPEPLTLFSMSLDPNARDAYGGQRQRPPQPGETLGAYADARGAERLVPEEAMMRLGFALSWMSLIAIALIDGAWRARNPPAAA